MVDFNQLSAGEKLFTVEKTLKEYVSGQDHAISFLARSFCDHLLALNNKEPVLLNKVPLIIGPTGSGKTYSAKTLASIFDIPFIDQDLTMVTSSGYQGFKLKDALDDLVVRSKNILVSQNKSVDNDQDLELAQYGIIILDELDKLAKKENHNGKDVSGEEVQNELLRFLEGGSYKLNDGRTFNTRNVYFVLTGAFENISKSKINNSFSESDFEDEPISEKSYFDITLQDIVDYGIVDQLAGRIGNIIPLNKLTKNDLKIIFRKSKDSLTDKTLLDVLDLQIKRYFPNVRLTTESVNYIVDKAYDLDKGARGLGNVTSNFYHVVCDYLHDNSGVVKISRDIINKAYERFLK